VLLLQNATITEQDMGVNILESGGLAKPEELIMYKAVLNSVQFLDVINNRPTCFSYKVLYKSISSNSHTDTNETFRTAWDSSCDVLRRIKGSLLGDALGEDGGLGDVKLQASILFEDMLELSQDLKRHSQLGLDVSIIRIRDRPGLGLPAVRLFCPSLSEPVRPSQSIVV
jgi:hypothetical protein